MLNIQLGVFSFWFLNHLIQDLVPQTELKDKITEFCKKHGIVMGNESVPLPASSLI